MLCRSLNAGIRAALRSKGTELGLKTISVIDDDQSVRSSTEGLLRSYGYRVRVYISADEFLASEDSLDCDCIVSDVQMPGKSGYELLR